MMMRHLILNEIMESNCIDGWIESTMVAFECSIRVTRLVFVPFIWTDSEVVPSRSIIELMLISMRIESLLCHFVQLSDSLCVHALNYLFVVQSTHFYDKYVLKKL